MKNFIITIIFFLGIPILIALSIYLWTDPFRCLHTFDINNTDATNREYLSTELYLHNKDSIHYDSFIFASSRGGGLNTYQWKQYLGEDAQPFLFQAWSETLTGEFLKLKFLDENGVQIKNAILMFDIPGTFKSEQLSHKALDMKHYIFTSGNRFMYNAFQFVNFLQKPSSWIKSIQKRDIKAPYCADKITNDWDIKNRYDYRLLPLQDSLKSCTTTTRNSLYARIKGKTIEDVTVSSPLIDKKMMTLLMNIKSILDRHQTNYAIVISPAICYTNPSINPDDLMTLKQIFGDNRIYNYSGINNLTIDVNNFSDPGHFGRRVGFLIIKDVGESNL